MTALMYKKPDDHIKFLEECLSKAEKENKIQWHTFIEPLPPIPKSAGKIRSENSEQLHSRKSISPVSPIPKHVDPLPPISHHESPQENESDTLVEESTTEEKAVDDSSLAKVDSKISIDDDVGLEEKGLPSEEKEELEMMLSQSAESQNKSFDTVTQIKAPVLFVLGKEIFKTEIKKFMRC